MKKAISMILAAQFVLFSLAGCAAARKEKWGSFTPDKTYNYDKTYYALQTVSDKMIVITVYKSETGGEVFSFLPARALDFRGICWESDTNNIWIQSGDIGVYCYRFVNEKWILDENAERPSDIISKYD